MNQEPELNELEKLNQLSKKELVKLILSQQEIIEQLKIEIEKLKISRSLDSKISSKPPSSDLLKKPERKEKSSSQKPKKSTRGAIRTSRENKKRIWASRSLRSTQSRKVLELWRTVSLSRINQD